MRKLFFLIITLVSLPAGAFTPAEYKGPSRMNYCPSFKNPILQEDGTTKFPSSHASTIVETPSGIHAAWFSGSGEGEKDVVILFSSLKNGRWTSPQVVADGYDSNGNRFPTWNPVLHYNKKEASLDLYYKVGPTPQSWWGRMTRSYDNGKSWSPSQYVLSAEGAFGPIKNKGIELPSGVGLFSFTMRAPGKTEAALSCRSQKTRAKPGNTAVS